MARDTPPEPGIPDDYETLGKEYPYEKEDLLGQEPKHEGDNPAAYEHIQTDAEGRPPGMRRTGEFEVPDVDNNEVTGEGWTVPTRAGGGWDQALDRPLEERLEEVDEDEEKLPPEP
jgi:hypothetical protein